jgi:hypothetical protein
MKTFVTVLLLACFIYSADFLCTNDKACEITGHLISPKNEPLFCNVTLEMCQNLVGVTWKPEGIEAPSGKYCSDSFRISDWPNYCYKYAFDGCEVKPYITCVSGNIKDGRCHRETVKKSEVVYNGEGGLCDKPENGVQHKCKYGFACVRHRCVRTLKEGSRCEPESEIICERGTICHSITKKCVLAYSGDNNSPCTYGHECKSGYCKEEMFCTPRSRTPCYSTADCVGNAVCKREKLQHNTPGVCFDPYYVAMQDYYARCIRSCKADDIENCKCVETEEVKQMCINYCFKRQDLRHGYLDGVYDCKKLTKRKFTSSDCEITTFFENCDAVLTYSGAISFTISFAALLISIVAVMF